MDVGGGGRRVMNSRRDVFEGKVVLEVRCLNVNVPSWTIVG